MCWKARLLFKIQGVHMQVIKRDGSLQEFNEDKTLMQFPEPMEIC